MIHVVFWIMTMCC